MKKESSSAGGVALWLFIILMLLLIILGGVSLLQKRSDTASVDVSENNTQPSQIAAESEPTDAPPTEPETTEEREISFDFIEIESETALLTDIDGNELYSKNQYSRIYPASLTKIMTAIVAIEHISDLDEQIMIPGDIYDQIAYENGSTAGFVAYECVTYRDMLYGAVLSSGAECCLTLASYISGSEWEFVELMNSKAKELGMSDTSFTNVCGFQNYEHYSTASDISLLLRYAFDTLGLRRVELTVFAENSRARLCYLKAGFIEEGVARQKPWKNGKFHDVVSMAVLRDEWAKREEQA